MKFVFKTAYKAKGTIHKTGGSDLVLFEGTAPRLRVIFTATADEHLFLLDRQRALAEGMLIGLVGTPPSGDFRDRLQLAIETVRDRRRNDFSTGSMLLIKIEGDIDATITGPSVELDDFIVCFDAYRKEDLVASFQPRISAILAALRSNPKIDLTFTRVISGSYLIDGNKIVHSFSPKAGRPPGNLVLNPPRA